MMDRDEENLSFGEVEFAGDRFLLIFCLCHPNINRTVASMDI